MNKTVNVNIGGTAFILDEDAYLMLRNYLNQIDVRLAPSVKKDTMEDIETRISDILTDNLTPRRQVVDMNIVRKTISIIGNASEFGEHIYNKEAGGTPYAEPLPEGRKRLMRSRTDRVFGGVCAGLAEYFDADVTLIRVITFILVFPLGLSLWVYIVAWIIIPQEPRGAAMNEKKPKYDERR